MTNGMYQTLRNPLCDLLGCDVPILPAGTGRIRVVVPAGERLRRMTAEAAASLARLGSDGTAYKDERHDGQ